MKKLTVALLISFLLIFNFSCLAQKDTLLKLPKNWRYEHLDFPLSFAPDIKYTGTEELRFASGMFDTLSTHYLTYIFVLSINNQIKFTSSEIHHFLSNYYKGLCYDVAKERSLSIDTSKIVITVNKIKNKGKRQSKNYNAQVVFFDVFTSGKKVTLYMELAIIKKTKKTYVLALVSPQLKQSKTWQELYQIRKEINFNK